MIAHECALVEKMQATARFDRLAARKAADVGTGFRERWRYLAQC